MRIMSGTVLTNEPGIVVAQLQDGSQVRALSVTWIAPGTPISVRSEGGKFWRVAGR